MEVSVAGKKVGRKSGSLTSVGGGGDGGNREPRGGGGDSDIPQPFEESYSKSKILTIFLLVVVVMTFGAMIGAYIVISTNGVLEWKPFNLPFPVYLSTMLIFAGSATYVAAQKAISKNNYGETKKWLLATTVFGGTFIGSQLVAWVVLSSRGLYMASNPYVAFFYFMTALHAVHVLGGVAALGYVTLMTRVRTESASEIERRRDISEAVGWYWHFMGALWLVLLMLLGFWK